ncbi:MAG: HAD family hydrolase [Candidatus Bathyarchaeota archaeon]|nr:HAD family hydrolase [Candidatus Bathyarchaeota archaeon]
MQTEKSRKIDKSVLNLGNVWILGKSSMPLKAVLFDMFDTLMMIEHNHAFYQPSLKKTHRFLVQNGVNVSFKVFSTAYVKARDALYTVADAQMEEPHFNVRIVNALQSLGYNFDGSSGVVCGATLAFCEEFMRYVRIDEHAESTVAKLHGKYKLGIVSNFAIPECVFKLLERHNLTGFFDVVVVSGAVNKRKPSPEIFQKALEKLGVDAESTVFVGDTVDADIQGPKSMGMKTIYIERRPQKEIEHTHPDEIIKSLNQLPAALERCWHDKMLH